MTRQLLTAPWPLLWSCRESLPPSVLPPPLSLSNLKSSAPPEKPAPLRPDWLSCQNAKPQKLSEGKAAGAVCTQSTET